MKTLLILALSLMVGCASSYVPTTEPDQRPTFSGSCKAECSFSYTDPRDRVAPARATNGWDFGNVLVSTAGSVLLGAAPWAAVGIISYEGLQAMRGHGATDNSVVTNTDNRVDYSRNSGRLNSDDDYTHDPLVVLQPPPVVVEPQPPIIVEQPDPVIINGPAP